MLNRSANKIALACLMAAGVWSAPLAWAQQDQCAGQTNPVARAQCYCLQGQRDYSNQTAAIIPQQAENDPYLTAVRNAKPGDNASLGAEGVAQSCSNLTKGAFDSLLGSAGSVFGVDIGALFGGVANATTGSICQSINSAILQKTSISCPRVPIPGFAINCNGGVSLGANGVQINGGGTLGGYSTSGFGTVSPNGVYSGNGSYNAGQGNRATGSISGAVQGAVSQAQSGGLLSTISNNVSCWISGSSC